MMGVGALLLGRRGGRARHFLLLLLQVSLGGDDGGGGGVCLWWCVCREWDSALRLVGPCLITTGCKSQAMGEGGEDESMATI